MSRINKFVLTVSLLIFIMISAVACGIYTQMVKERVYSLKQSVIDTAFAVANIAEYRRSVAIDLINTLNPTEEQLLVGLRARNVFALYAFRNHRDPVIACQIENNAHNFSCSTENIAGKLRIHLYTVWINFIKTFQV